MSLREALVALGPSIGVADLAQEDFIRRGMNELPEDAPAHLVARWAGELRSRAGHLFVQPIIHDTAMQERADILRRHPAETITQARQGQAPVTRRLKPYETQRAWTSEECKTLEGKSLHERLTAGHAGPPKAEQGQG